MSTAPPDDLVPDDDEVIIRLLSVGQGFRLFAQQEGESRLGDHFVHHDVLRDGDGKDIGRDAGLCTLVSDTSHQLNVTMELPDGCITAQGFVREEVGLLAVTGGTEAYRNVRGDVLISRRSEEGLDVTLRLSGVRYAQ